MVGEERAFVHPLKRTGARAARPFVRFNTHFCGRAVRAPLSLQRRRHDLLRLGDEAVEVRGAFEALGIDLVDVLRAGREITPISRRKGYQLRTR
jgi:hypothetical protein